MPLLFKTLIYKKQSLIAESLILMTDHKNSKIGYLREQFVSAIKG